MIIKGIITYIFDLVYIKFHILNIEIKIFVDNLLL